VAQSVAIIGAGIAGLSCADELLRAEYSVKIFEKSRGLSGRCSTRVVDDHRFDHGAQFFTAKSKPFADFIERGLRLGLIDHWQPRVLGSDVKRPWYVGTPGMSAIGRAFSSNQFSELNCLVESLAFTDGKWIVCHKKSDVLFQEVFDKVVLAIPAIQAQGLLSTIRSTSLPNQENLQICLGDISQVKMLPCWTVMLSTGNDFGLSWPFDVYQVPEAQLNHQGIAWFAKNSSKPHRPKLAGIEDWVIQASPSWSEKHLEEDPEKIIQELIQELEDFLKLPISGQITRAVAHRWRYARVVPPMTEKLFWYCPENQLGLCGDYFSTSRVESAFLSGLELAKNIINV
jgi:renalase